MRIEIVQEVLGRGAVAGLEVFLTAMITREVIATADREAHHQSPCTPSVPPVLTSRGHSRHFLQKDVSP